VLSLTKNHQTIVRLRRNGDNNNQVCTGENPHGTHRTSCQLLEPVVPYTYTSRIYLATGDDETQT